MSKGSTPRPIQVSNEEYAQRWDLIFGRDKPKDTECKNCEQCDCKEEPKYTGSFGWNEAIQGMTRESKDENINLA